MRKCLLPFFVAMLGAIGPARAQLTAADVQRVINQATTRATQISSNSVIAVVDREGFVLGVWNVRGGEPTPAEIAAAVSKAGTGSFLSSNANAFTTRTAGFIIQEHFPPGVFNTAPGPLVGVGFSNLPFSDVNRFKQFLGPVPPPPAGVSPGTRGLPIAGTSLSGTPGGLPLYKNNQLVGGIGVIGDNTQGFVVDYDKDEDVALAGQIGFWPPFGITADNVFINGISLPYIESGTTFPAPLVLRGNAAAGFPIQASPPAYPYPTAVLSGVAGQIRQPIMSDPIAGPINGQPRLSASEVTEILSLAADRVRTTRAGIRLPIGTRMEVFITVVNNPNAPGIPPTVLGTFRTGDATMFSWDVAVQKARTALGFSSNTSAFSTRTVSFLAQTHYPPGIDPESPGPFFGMQEMFSTPPPGPRFPNGITIFPGGFPLYRNGQLIGAIGVSGDGVDQDDIASASGTQRFLPPELIRADQFNFDGTRLPYAKFPRDPNGINGITPVTLPAFSASSADFNNDSQVDLVWQNSANGQRVLWFLNGTTLSGQYALPTVSTAWQIGGTGDFNRDGQRDLLWENDTTGQRSIWLMNGATMVGQRSLPTIPTAWKIAGTGDFNRDDHTDILWQNNVSGQRAIWLMHGATRTGESTLPTVATQWQIAGTGDFNADRQPDILWQNNLTGQRAVWLMNGTSKGGDRALPTVPMPWKIAGAGDFNRDAKADIVWQNQATGQRAIWLMNGTTRIGDRSLPTAPAQWDIRNH